MKGILTSTQDKTKGLEDKHQTTKQKANELVEKQHTMKKIRHTFAFFKAKKLKKREDLSVLR